MYIMVKIEFEILKCRYYKEYGNFGCFCVYLMEFFDKLWVF